MENLPGVRSPLSTETQERLVAALGSNLGPLIFGWDGSRLPEGGMPIDQGRLSGRKATLGAGSWALGMVSQPKR